MSRDKARGNYQRALDILPALKADNAFAETDENFLKEMQAAASKFQK